MQVTICEDIRDTDDFIFTWVRLELMPLNLAIAQRNHVLCDDLMYNIVHGLK